MHKYGALLATVAMNSGKDPTLVAVSSSLTKEKVQCVSFWSKTMCQFFIKGGTLVKVFPLYKIL